ncbi:PucR C-terminal helix-turn-helix domain-containing protein [Amycolatopsis pretoriensis]|uniref:PucR C-terminal helix-turn-helix domain-containing protein n=1 Tax=Amycolatopsis pretoriensis TaxID=218821 RepID=A0A1H5RHJ0_9PSEU|nr:helix-turn-helix domain-containing protein [Amycolatopsis pretoriensis]SEF37770.1 PucR C-terminal helix-turn-helix domain-containing protein [Amycolatopsis pretoriensis]
MTAATGSADRADDIVALTRLSTEPGAVGAMLGWLAARTGGTAALLDVDGRTLAVPANRPAPDPPVLAAAAAAAAEMHRRGTPSAVLGGEPDTIDVVRLGTGDDAARVPYLVVAHRAERRPGALLADAARLLGLCWRVAEADRTRRRVASAMSRSREAVLHLLMIGSLAAARRIAATLGPRLPDVARVVVVECPGGGRLRIAGEIESFARGRAWIVPCPVRPHHLIALVPPERAHGGRPRLDLLIAERAPEARVGASQEVPLRETALGYEQAFHALAVARGVPGGYACFDRRTDLTPFLGGRGPAWAAEFLTPCLSHVPARRADPGAEELLATLTSWLTFDSGARHHLKIHRNTLSARLRVLEDLLGLDLTRVADQSAAWLALRLHAAGIASPDAGAGSLEDLLASPGAVVWARSQLLPLDPAGIETVRAWLRADTRLPATASALGISAPAARKRLARIERALGRSLLHAPSARHELWLAMRALDAL